MERGEATAEQHETTHHMVLGGAPQMAFPGQLARNGDGGGWDFVFC